MFPTSTFLVGTYSRTRAGPKATMLAATRTWQGKENEKYGAQVPENSEACTLLLIVLRSREYGGSKYLNRSAVTQSR